MDLIKQIREQEKRWNRSKRIEAKQKRKLFELLRKQTEKASGKGLKC